MCTVSWFTTPSGYELFFNRDESRQRVEALPPEVFTDKSCEFLSPTDAQGGGSWIAVNQFGITACLLNLYTEADLVESDHFVSRGKVIRDIADVESLAEVRERVSSFDLTQFRTFRVFAIDTAGKNILLIWNGMELLIEYDTRSPKSSSSVDTEAVRDGRKAMFHEAGLETSTDREAFFAFQRGHEPNTNYSVCVHRENTKTVSMSHIVVDHGHAVFDYFADSPCQCTVPMSKEIVRSTINCQSDVA